MLDKKAQGQRFLALWKEGKEEEAVSKFPELAQEIRWVLHPTPGVPWTREDRDCRADDISDIVEEYGLPFDEISWINRMLVM